MQPKLNDFSPSALIPAIETSLREFWGNWGLAPQSDLLDGPSMLRLFTGVPYPFCNGVICTQLSPDEVDMEIDATVNYYHARNALWEWMVGPNSNPASLDKFLVKHGLVVRGESIGMAVNLHSLNQDISPAPNFRIIPVDGDDTLKLWTNTMMQGFESPALFPAFVDLECSLGYHNQSYRRYLGVLDGQPISTTALFLVETVAGVYCVSTLPNARKLGSGAAITLHALQDAKAMGYHIAVLQSTKMGRTVYQRLGFQEFSILRAYSPA